MVVVVLVVVVHVLLNVFLLASFFAVLFCIADWSTACYVDVPALDPVH